GDKTMNSIRYRFAWLLAAASLALGQSAWGQAYPNRPIRIVVASTAGGAADIISRLMAPDMAATLGQQVIVDNRPGAGNIIGSEVVAKAPADGYTLLMAINNHVINATVYKNLSYDPIKDFTGVTLVATTPHMLVVHPSVGVKTVDELIKKAKAEPGKLNYSSAGNGTAAQFAAEEFNMLANVRITHVPYKGVTPAVTDLVAGMVQVMFPAPITVMPHLKSGRLIGLAVTTTKRVRLLPDLPTLQEAGLQGYEFSSWYGLLAPRDTPPAIVAALHKAATHAMATKAVTGRLVDDATDPVGNTPEQFNRFLGEEFERYSKLVKAMNLKVE
ncbi:MAG TPA: tripartite tricarboxylate transporter substrate binding protein, partial [Burkholderiales bacterium]|nr:tripartite tricarboxylate transporter substrate binding protein [Burkholderiales bacterium]